MALLVLDRDLEATVLSLWEQDSHQRLRDEVWDGVRFIMPEADNSHDKIAAFFHGVFFAVFGGDPNYALHFRINLSDRERGWKKNYRVPDMAFFSTHGPARDCGSHWLGGPEVALEVMSPGDRSRDKLDFYAKIGTREVLILDRHPWQLELYQLRRGHMRMKGVVTPGDGKSISSAVVPFQFEVLRGRPRPRVKITHVESGRDWMS
jgi:Uma2 family endonuclease